MSEDPQELREALDAAKATITELRQQRDAALFRLRLFTEPPAEVPSPEDP